MENQYVKISVIVPSYNQSEYLDECLQSVFDQTYDNWECIIVNDGSPDYTEEIAKRWRLKDQRFRYFSQENRGVSAARNLGISKAYGEWILPLDGDDKIDREYLALASDRFAENPHIIICNGKHFGESKKDVRVYFDDKVLLVTNLIFSTSFFRKESWQLIGGYDENMHQGYEDWEFWVHLYSRYGELKAVHLPYCLFYYRIKKQSRNTDAVTADRELREYIFDKHIQFYKRNIAKLASLFIENIGLKQENKFLRALLGSKRYQATDKLLSIFNK